MQTADLQLLEDCGPLSRGAVRRLPGGISGGQTEVPLNSNYSVDSPDFVFFFDSCCYLGERGCYSIVWTEVTDPSIVWVGQTTTGHLGQSILVQTPRVMSSVVARMRPHPYSPS
jgi:hypothetical protein